MKLTKKLRDRCWRAITDFAAEFVGEPNKSLHELAEDLAACEVEEEPVKWIDAHNALEAAGWIRDTDYRPLTRILYRTNDGRYCLLVVNGDTFLIVIRTRYCPPDLLDGRLAALDEEA